MCRDCLLVCILLLVLGAGARAAGPPLVVGLEGCWADLASPDAGRGYAALCRLAAHPAWAVPLFRKRLRPVPAVNKKRIARLVAALDDDNFDVRDRAHQELVLVGDQARSALLQALKGEPGPELRKRARELLKKIEGPVRDPDKLRRIRAVEALERMGTPEAVALLRKLAGGAPAARLTREARESLARLREGRLKGPGRRIPPS
jgi:hypothetical protein